jgi:hypothetical protein
MKSGHKFLISSETETAEDIIVSIATASNGKHPHFFWRRQGVVVNVSDIATVHPLEYFIKL